MKAFLRVTELDPSSVYAHYQIATVKQKLGMYVEAIEIGRASCRERV